MTTLQATERAFEIRRLAEVGAVDRLAAVTSLTVIANQSGGKVAALCSRIASTLAEGEGSNVREFAR